MSPKVSVIIPTYNRAKFISETLESVFSQTFTDYEVIVVDDGSTDNTIQILANYGDRLRVISLEENTGPSVSRNIALRAAQGEFIALLDSDDLWYPNMLATTVDYLEHNPNTDLVCGAWDIIDETGRVITPTNKPSNFQARLQTDFLRVIALGNIFLVHALLIRRKCFECCGCFDPQLKATVDWDLWIRMAMHDHKVDMIDVPVAHYRRHSGCITRDPQRMLHASEQVLSKLFSNEQFASRLADLREHAYIQTWLTIATYYYEGGITSERRRFVQMAQDLYLKAPKSRELDQRHLSVLFRLPETEAFKRMIVASSSLSLVYYLRRGWQLLQNKQFKVIYERLKWRNTLPLALGVRDAFLGRIKR